ncbi:hypothetical protein N7539_009537 [Penicillium diatomitis]|uniref:HSF-type DNA-binding domain-containing protein n=1 Tax=Penicillium diatomitis TaxID=2819901 RepID=A0A9W9WKV3_9EURO|nr:uncharacterized protein N7539_009537 [Penicillium diatomitis]KAJ5466581.1 hypothetical protein N7539_009537 [Penicillium diatomitis]
MNSQGMTRKRPAPGTTPQNNPQLLQAYQSVNPNPRFSNDQFLQWGAESATNTVNHPYIEPSAYGPAAYAASQDHAPSGLAPSAITTATNSTQLARRSPQNQLISRNRSYEQSPAPFTDSSAGAGNAESAWEESIEELYARAAAAKRDATSKRKQIPPFVQKLSSFLDESKNTELIRWSDDGNSFIVLDEDEFARRLIPELFKHNNYASFVRQLNMYGFHKKVGLSDNSMRASERKNKSPSEYSNPFFKRGHPELLWLISKPKNQPGHGAKGSKAGSRVKTEEADENEGEDYGEEAGAGHREDRARARPLHLITDSAMPKERLDQVIHALNEIRMQQARISGHIESLRHDHELLSAQAASFQEQHTRHENSINAILTFLATVYNRSLQQGDSASNIASSFAGVISGDQQGNIVDMGGDFGFNPMASMASPTGQRTLKRQPLLLKAPPTANEGNRATTLSPAATGPYDNRSRNNTRQPSASQPGHVEELLDTSPRQAAANYSMGNGTETDFPEKEMLSVIQNSNARHASPNTITHFPDVLSSLEKGGNGAITPGVRADMLRMMANKTGHDADSASANNALVSPTPPPMPQDYSNRLSKTRQQIDSLARLQAQQDRSVQDLTNLLQPLSPTGNIPGLNNDNAPPIDLENIFDLDYFSNDVSGSAGEVVQPAHDSSTAGTGTTAHQGDPAMVATVGAQPDNTDDFMAFNDDPLFAQAQPSQNLHPHDPSYGYGFDGTGYGADVGSGNLDSSRIVEQLTDSEATSPAAAVEDPDAELDDGGSATKRRRKA